MFKKLLMTMGLICCANIASAAIQSSNVEYKTADGRVMQGYFAVSDALTPKKGSIILVPD